MAIKHKQGILGPPVRSSADFYALNSVLTLLDFWLFKDGVKAEKPQNERAAILWRQEDKKKTKLDSSGGLNSGHYFTYCRQLPQRLHLI